MTFGRPSRFLSEIDPRYLDLQFELGDSRDSDEEANSAPRYGRPGGPSRYGRPGTGPSQGYGQGGYGKRAGAPDTGAPRRTDTPSPGARFRSLNARGATQGSPATASPASRFSAPGTGRPAVRPTAPRRISAPAYRRCDIRLPTCYRRHERLRPSRRILLAGFRRNGRRHTGRARQVRRGRDRRDRRVDQRRKADGGFRRGRQESAPKEVRQTANPLIRRLTATRRRRPALPAPCGAGSTAPGPATPPHSGRHDKPQQPIFRPICKESSGFCFSTCSAASSRR